MGFLTKLFGKKNRNEDIPAEELPAEQAGEDPDGEGALTAEEEAAAEAAEQAFFAEHPEIAGEDILDEELRLEQEQQEREAAEEAESADSTGSAGNAEDMAEPAEEPAEEPTESEPADAPAEAVAARRYDYQEIVLGTAPGRVDQNAQCTVRAGGQPAPEFHQGGRGSSGGTGGDPDQRRRGHDRDRGDTGSAP